MTTDSGRGDEGQAGEHAPPQGRESDEAAAKKDKEFEEASAVVARHVKLLREYNEIKDVGQQLMGLVAENRGATVGSLYETGEFGVGPKD
ncbi:DNA repair protein SWI5-like protein [Colletotrichum sp. SAR 10_99]|nr:DNA repair protein SWI5-like protein [Colletotrichum sp. SAR 10_96]KAJ5019930.1 DNA repair protein SWI5-like protein [Colletotrichum sp. SAR 10_99]